MTFRPQNRTQYAWAAFAYTSKEYRRKFVTIFNHTFLVSSRYKQLQVQTLS